MSMVFKRKLPIPKEIKERFPLDARSASFRESKIKEIKDILSGKDRRLLMIIGPCSADREDAVLDYISRLARVQREVADRLLIVARVYTNKPRTAGIGYKGMLHTPNLAKEDSVLEGVIKIRQMHINVLKETAMVAADEILYPDYYRYFSDLIAYAAVGARSTENQQHRLVSSGLDIPVGMKNPTAGGVQVMLNSIGAAQHGYNFIYRGYEVQSGGNPFSHGILRGGTCPAGGNIPNYRYEDLLHLHDLYSKTGFKNKAIIVDCNHANSGKLWYEQRRICKDVIGSMEISPPIKEMVKGFMVESYIEDGNQGVDGGVYGKSVTDPCMGWSATEEFLKEIAEISG